MSDKTAAGCERILLQLSAAQDGELSPRQTAALEEHLRGCAGCRARQALWSATADAVRARAVAAAELVRLDGFADRVLARVSADERARSNVLPFRARLGVAATEEWRLHKVALSAGGGLLAAAGLALALFVGPFAPTPEGRPALLAQAGSGATTIQELEYAAPNAAVLELPGQTTVIWVSDDASGAK